MPSQKPVLPPLQTPKNTTAFSANVRRSDDDDDDPSTTTTASVTFTDPVVKHEPSYDRSSTPITPPVAYTEFLKALTPIFSPYSPIPSSTGASFSKSPLGKPYNSTTTTASSNGSGGSAGGGDASRNSTLSSKSQPASASAVGHSSLGFNESLKSASSPFSPHTPFTAPLPVARGAGPNGVASPGYLRIPRLSTTATAAESPRSATSLRSPFSPRHDWRMRYAEVPRSAGSKPVSVRQVVTRTVTYKRTQLEAPPKGKRRKHREPKSNV